MEWLSDTSSLIILIGAVVVAVTNIWKFFYNGGEGIKKRFKKAKQEQKEQGEQFVRDVIAKVQEEQADAKKTIILEIIEDAYRTKYLYDIKSEVKKDLKVNLNLIDSIKDDVAALAESAKDVLREKIMALYHKNKRARALEEHEKEALTQYYKDYKAIGGNSYIDKYYGRMQTWEVIPDDYIEN